MRGLRAMFRGVRWQVLVRILIGLVRIAASLAFVWICKVLVDIATGNLGADIHTYVWVFVGIMLLQLVSNVSASYWESLITVKAQNKMRYETFGQFKKQSVLIFDRLIIPSVFLCKNAVRVVNMFLLHIEHHHFRSVSGNLPCQAHMVRMKMGNKDIMIMCLVFILAGAFTATAQAVGGVTSAVMIAEHFIPPSFMVSGLFVISALISLSIGTPSSFIS